MLRFHSLKKVKRICPVDHISVIGNAPNVFHYRIGEIIDRADCVIRINNYFLNEDIQPYIGNKTDVYVTNFYRKDPMKTKVQLSQDGVKMIWSAVPNTKYLHYVDWTQDLKVGEQDYSNYDIFVPSTFQYFNGFNRSNARILGRYLLYKTYGQEKYRKMTEALSVPSSGIITIIMAIALKPKQITLAGFNFFKTLQTHYYEDSRRLGFSHHIFEEEPNVVASLIRKNPSIKFRLAMESDFEGFESLANEPNVGFVKPTDSHKSCIKTYSNLLENRKSDRNVAVGAIQISQEEDPKVVSHS